MNWIYFILATHTLCFFVLVVDSVLSGLNLARLRRRVRVLEGADRLLAEMAEIERVTACKCGHRRIRHNDPPNETFCLDCACIHFEGR